MGNQWEIKRKIRENGKTRFFMKNCGQNANFSFIFAFIFFKFLARNFGF